MLIAAAAPVAAAPKGWKSEVTNAPPRKTLAEIQHEQELQAAALAPPPVAATAAAAPAPARANQHSPPSPLLYDYIFLLLYLFFFLLLLILFVVIILLFPLLFLPLLYLHLPGPSFHAYMLSIIYVSERFVVSSSPPASRFITKGFMKQHRPLDVAVNWKMTPPKKEKVQILIVCYICTCGMRIFITIHTCVITLKQHRRSMWQ